MLTGLIAGSGPPGRVSFEVTDCDYRTARGELSQKCAGSPLQIVASDDARHNGNAGALARHAVLCAVDEHNYEANLLTDDRVGLPQS